MIRFVILKLQKLLIKNWSKIFANWIWIYQYVKTYWFQILIYVVLNLISTCFGLGSSIVSKNLIDAVTGFNTKSIGWAFSLYAGLGISRIFMNILSGKIALLIQTKVSNEIRADIFDQIMHTEWESVSRYSTGDLLVRISNDTGMISGSVLNFVPNAVTAIVNFIGAFAIMFYHDPIMALIALAGAPVTVITSRYRLEKMQEFQREGQQMASKKMAFDQETFQNIQSIKAFGLIGQFSEKMRQIQTDALDLSLRQYKYQSWTGVIVSLSALAVSYACYGFAIYRLWKGDITYGTLTLFMSMASSLSNSFSSVVSLIPTAIRAATSAERIREIICLPQESCENLDSVRVIYERSKSTGAFLKMQDVTFQYKNGCLVYNNASLRTDPGEIIALIGPSGQGKTTTLRLFLGLLNAYSGTLTVGNPEETEVEVSSATRCLFSYVPQGNTMFHGTIAENLRMVKPQATDEELQEILESVCAWEFVSKLENGLDTVVGERGLGFSEGQNQRLAIARALLADTPILLLDEATSALDVATERHVLQRIMKKTPYKTIIVTAHRPSVFSICDRIYKIDNCAVQELDNEEIRDFLGN